MQQVVDEAGLTWLETPDQAVVWGTALGLQDEIEDVLQRSSRTSRDPPPIASSTYFPAWYRTGTGRRSREAGAAGSGGSIFSGLGRAGPRRDDVGARDDRELPGIVGRQRWRRVQRRLVGRWRRRGRRRVLGPTAGDPGAHAPNSSRQASSPSISTVRPRPRPPVVDGHPEPLRLARDALRRQRPTPVLLVPECRARPRSRRRCRGRPTTRRPARPGRRTRTRAPPTASPCRGPDPGTPARATNPCRPSGGSRTRWPRCACVPIARPSARPPGSASTPPRSRSRA